MRPSTPRGASAARNLVISPDPDWHLLHHELAFRLVSSRLCLQLAGFTLSPADGPPSSTPVWVRSLHQLQVRSFHSFYHQPPILSTSAVDCLSSFSSLRRAATVRRVRDVACSCSSCAILMALHESPAMALHGSAVSPAREPLFSTSCSPVQVLTHVSSSASTRSCFPQQLRHSARCAWVCSPALSRRGSPATARLVGAWHVSRPRQRGPCVPQLCQTVWAWNTSRRHSPSWSTLCEGQREAAISVVHTTSENQADHAAASLRRCLKLSPWRLGVHPTKAWSNDNHALTSLSQLSSLRLALAWLRPSWSAGTSRRRHACVD